MSHDPHIGFVIAAYALGLAIVAGMVVTILVDYRNLKRTLASFAAREKFDNADAQVLDVAAHNPDQESLT